MDEISPDHVKLSWEKPLNDGGGKIQGYIIEKKTKDGDWEDATPLLKDTEGIVPNLKEGEEYQFRVKAVNAAGPGNPSRPTAGVVAEKQPEKPEIDKNAPKEITVRAGQEIKIALPINGHPPPKATWDKDGKPLDEDARTDIKVGLLIH